MNKLNILWTTTNKETILNMLAMYASNAKTNKWWEEVNILVWGGSARLIAEDPQIQNEVIEMLHKGVHIEACKACADNLGVADALTKLGIKVHYTGEVLTQYLKSEVPLLSL